ncbi:MAG: hypothetical protein CVU90_10795 [Firmicutes bacterium HGW-Firmicutes-15]|nr:MAG: hypothetical protein CVU90_10795 [Firmicutes bacterium HGW-Firmicutes-15]
MEFIFTREIKADLLDVDKIFKRSLLPWWDEIDIYARKINGDLSFQLLPALVIGAYRCLGLERELSIQMANLYKTIDFANKIHLMVKDEEEGQEHNQELQFTILIGDYIFGKVFSLLLETRADKLLDSFAAMICEINEGLIVKYKLKKDLLEVLARTRGPLFNNAFKSAAELAGLAPEITGIYGELGSNLGIALELIYVHQQKQDAGDYLIKVEQLLQSLSSRIIGMEPVFEKLVQEMNREIGGSTNGL